MRTVSFFFLTLAAGSVLHAAASREATYVIGNLDGVSAGASGYVRAEADHLTFHTGKVTVEAPYAKITSSELGSKLTHPSDASKLKFWEFGKHLSSKTVYQNVTVNFKNGSGNDQTMTLELTEAAALEIHNALGGRIALAGDEVYDSSAGADFDGHGRQEAGWWGDEAWKTNRNVKTWDSQTAALGK